MRVARGPAVSDKRIHNALIAVACAFLGLAVMVGVIVVEACRRVAP